LTADLVVVVPGITGSSLADADDREVWGLGPGGVLRALATLGGSLRSLTLPPGLGDEPAPDGVTATGLIRGLHVIPGVWSPIPGYAALERFLARERFGLIPDRPDEAGSPPGNLVLFAYDWRLSNRRTGQSLKMRVESALERWRDSAVERRHAQVVFICHSMGGLAARWYIECAGGAEVTRALVTLGTPHRGALKSLEQLVNGVRKGIGPLTFDLTRFARSLPSSYQLLPEYACITTGAGGKLAKTTEVPLPGLDEELVADGMLFHEQLDSSEEAYPLVPVVGIGQPTWTTARLESEGITPLWEIEGVDRAGDGTVPRPAARPRRLPESDPSIRGVGEGHGALSGHRSVLDQLDFLLTAEDVSFRAADREGPEERIPGVSVPDLHEAGESVRVRVRLADPRVLQVVACDEADDEVKRELVRFTGEFDEAGRAIGYADFDPLHPGGYTLVVHAPDDSAGAVVSRVHAATLVASL
jgi:hypothetical protein